MLSTQTPSPSTRIAAGLCRGLSMIEAAASRNAALPEPLRNIVNGISPSVPMERPPVTVPRQLPRSLAARLGIARRRCALMSGMGERYDVAKSNLRRVLAEVVKYRELTEAEKWYLAEKEGGAS